MSNNNILVLGGTGKTGKRVAGRLLKMNLPVRIGSRNANPKFEWEDQSNWADVLKDISKVYITFQPDLAVPGAVEMIRSFSKMAAECGVKKLVLLSGRGEVEARQCEEAVIEGGTDFTILRCSLFCQNFSEGNFLEPVLAGYVTLSAGDVAEPFIDVEDIAEVAVAALTNEKHNGKIYELTGPRLLTFKQAVTEIARATGKPIQYEQVSMEAYSLMLVEYGVPKEYISLLTYLFTEVLDGRNAHVTDGVERALGRKATDFSQYVRTATASGIWG